MKKNSKFYTLLSTFSSNSTSKKKKKRFPLTDFERFPNDDDDVNDDFEEREARDEGNGGGGDDGDDDDRADVPGVTVVARLFSCGRRRPRQRPARRTSPSN